jgi:hypothetical protein
MVWKKTKKVGFGIKGKWVFAWYCDAKPNKGSFVENIGGHCIKSGVNKCINEKLSEETNKKRKSHGAKGIPYDNDIAKAIQVKMDEKASGFDGVISVSGDYVGKCTQNIFEQKDPSKILALHTTSAE